MTVHTRLFLLLFCALGIHGAYAQTRSSNARFFSLTYPRSVVSFAQGELGVTLQNAADALQYNPANLALTERSTLSFFRNPSVMNLHSPWPLTSMAVSTKLSSAVSVAAEYTDWDRGEYPVTTEQFPDGTGETYRLFERSVAGALGLRLGGDWAVGAEARYAWEELFSLKIHHLLVSAGAAYAPQALSDRLHVGLSFMNFSTPAEISTVPMTYPGGVIPSQIIKMPMPARLYLGADGAVVRERLFDITLSLGFTKPLENWDDDPSRSGQSSFTALFTDWKDFPNDVIMHVGAGYKLDPISLGAGVSYFQEMYLGYFTTGQWPYYTSWLTHGAVAGIEAYGVRASAGYAGRWHDNNKSHQFMFYYREFESSESFQFSISTNVHLPGTPAPRVEEPKEPASIIVTAGYAYCSQFGRMKEEGALGYIGSHSQHALWTVGSDFYWNARAAVVTRLAYAHMVESLSIPWSARVSLTYPYDIETLALESGFRYHPVDAFEPLFVQASLGLLAMNPVTDYYGMRHKYFPFTDLAAGLVIPLSGSGLTLMPQAGVKSTFMEAFLPPGKLAAFHQFEAGLNIGYRL